MATNPQDEKLRAELASLRLDRGPAAAPVKPRRQRRRVLPVVIAVALLAALAAWILLAGRAVPVTVVYATLAASGQAGPAPVLSGSGYIVTGDRYVSIGVRVPGRIERYFVEEGQRVHRGDALVQLDDRDYRSAVTRTEAQLAVARANLDLAEAELRRNRALRRNGVVSAQELDVQENKASVARATVAQLEAELAQARVNLEYTVLRAPTDGVILAKLKEVGEIAVPGGFAGSGDLVRMANLTDIRAEVDVNEADLNRIHLGQRAQVTPDAYPDARYPAAVVKLYPQVDRQKGTLKVEVHVLEPDARLLPDMSARITFLADPAPAAEAERPAVLVPAAALRRDAAGNTFVWVVRDGRARQAPVETAGEVGDRIRIAKGLSGGEAIVVGTPPARDGARVRIADPGA
ncbi:MAG: efflux RND transporter periplasmic adaptor subunit [Deltaproteobacteria bacterium]|nr:MAG: efflux RND transporter periplasmic adaptor subunit [Deltaproteobacteria bacterium]